MIPFPAIGGFRHPGLVIAAALLLFPATARAALEIEAKSVEAESDKKKEIWVIRIDLKNTGSTPLGPLVIQYRYSGFSEFDSDGKPEGALKHNERTLKHEPITIAAGQQTSVDSPGMNFAGGADERKLAKGMIQSIRVRAWQNGKLVGEFAEKGGKAAEVEWPMNPPAGLAVPAGAEAVSGPWLLLDKTRADFSGIPLGASAAEVLKMLKTCGTGKVEAKPEPLHGHPLRMTSADLPGVTFGFDAAKKLSAIEITDPSRLKLPGKLLLGKSKLEDFDAAFGAGTKPDLLPTGAADARQFQLTGSRLTLSDPSTAPGLGITALLEKTP